MSGQPCTHERVDCDEPDTGEVLKHGVVYITFRCLDCDQTNAVEAKPVAGAWAEPMPDYDD